MPLKDVLINYVLLVMSLLLVKVNVVAIHRGDYVLYSGWIIRPTRIHWQPSLQPSLCSSLLRYHL